MPNNERATLYNHRGGSLSYTAPNRMKKYNVFFRAAHFYTACQMIRKYDLAPFCNFILSLVVERDKPSAH